jgi:hypothetical protein
MNRLTGNHVKILIALMIAFSFTACTALEGDDPGVENARDKFLGTWTVDESCVRLDYEVVILPDENSESKVLLENFAFTGPGYEPAYGFVNESVIDLPQQIIGDNWSVSGTGTYMSDGTITWSYYIEIGSNGSNCEADYR